MAKKKTTKKIETIQAEMNALKPFKIDDLNPESKLYKTIKRSILSIIVSMYKDKIVTLELSQLYEVLETELNAYKKEQERLTRDIENKNQLSLFENDDVEDYIDQRPD
jgi:chaperonin cofactor prefoldin